MAAHEALRITTAGTQAAGTLRPVFAGPQRRQLPSELGITDAVLATIWRLGPEGITHEIAPLAERHFTGADIAFVDGASGRILLYQAKVAWKSAGLFQFKSVLTAQHRALLTTKAPLSISGRDYSITGRLALYQADHGGDWTDFAPSYPAWRNVSITGLAGWPLAALVQGTAAQEYYATVMAGAKASPCGVMAGGLVAGSTEISSIKVRHTWPWEYDAYQWCTRQQSPLGDLRRNADTTIPEVPGFVSSDDGPSGWETRDYGDLADLAEALRLLIDSEEARQLYVIAF